LNDAAQPHETISERLGAVSARHGRSLFNTYPAFKKRHLVLLQTVRLKGSSLNAGSLQDQTWILVDVLSVIAGVLCVTITLQLAFPRDSMRCSDIEPADTDRYGACENSIKITKIEAELCALKLQICISRSSRKIANYLQARTNQGVEPSHAVSESLAPGKHNQMWQELEGPSAEVQLGLGCEMTRARCKAPQPQGDEGEEHICDWCSC